MKLLAILLAIGLSTNAFADRRHAPFQPHDDKRFDEIEDQLEDVSEAAGLAQKQARFVYDVSVDGGSSAADIDLGVSIPAGAVNTKLIIYINTKFVDSGTGSLAIQCAGSQDILGYVDITQFEMNTMIIGDYEDANTNAPLSKVLIPGAVAAGAQPTSVVVSNVNSVVSACSIEAKVRNDAGYVDLTAGKLTGIVEYFMFQ
jgi:hypothetical protein